MNKPYPRVTPSFVVLWNYENADGDAKPLVFATASAAKDFWRIKTGRATRQADIQRYVFHTKSQMVNAIQDLLRGQE